MFWDKISSLYDIFETVYNGRVYTGTGKKVAEFIEPSDEVLECACGTGAISIYIAPKCKRLIATDFAPGMLRQAPRVVHTFAKGYDWTGKKVHLFATSGGSGIGKTAEKLSPSLQGADSVDAKLVHNASEI